MSKIDYDIEIAVKLIESLPKVIDFINHETEGTNHSIRQELDNLIQILDYLRGEQ